MEAAANTSKHTRRRGSPALPLTNLRDHLIAATLDDLILDTSGRFHALVCLTGSGISLVPDELEAEWLAAFERYLERYEDPVMRLSSSYPQPLDTYTDWLESCCAARQAAAPHHVRQLAAVAQAMQEAVATVQARLFADYLVLAYTPPILGKRSDPSRSAGKKNATWLRLHLKHTERARQELHRRCLHLGAALGLANLTIRRVAGEELEALIDSAWGTAFAEGLPEDAPALAPAAQVEREWARTPSGCVRSYLVRDVGEFLTPDLITALAREQGVRILQFWQRIPINQAKKILKFNRTIQATARHLRSRREVTDLDALRDEQRIEAERGKLSFQGTHLFLYRAILQQWAPTLPALEERAQALEMKLETQGELLVSRATFQQEHALLSGLPVAWPVFRGPARTLNAASLARLAWPGPHNMLGQRGVWLGVALPSQQIHTLDVLSLKNPVVELLGVMGSGKSLTQKFLVSQLVYQGYPAYVVNSARLSNGRGEYQDLVEQELGGLVVRLGRGSGVSFNPLQLVADPTDEEDDPFLAGQDQLLAWLDALLRTPLTDMELAVVARAYLLAMQRRGILPQDPSTWDKPSPILSDFCQALLEEPGEPLLEGADRKAAIFLAYKLKNRLSGPAARLFNQPEQLPLEAARVVCFDLSDVPNQLRACCFQQVLTLIRRLTSRHARTGGSVVLLDEAHLLLQDARSAGLLGELVRGSRKAGRLILFTNHMAQDSQSNDAARLAHGTSGATMLFRINPQDEQTPSNLHLSPLEEQAVTRLGRPDGECLLITPQGHMLVQVLVPPPWYLRFTTKPAELLRLEANTSGYGAVADEYQLPGKDATLHSSKEPGSGERVCAEPAWEATMPHPLTLPPQLLKGDKDQAPDAREQASTGQGAWGRLRHA